MLFRKLKNLGLVAGCVLALSGCATDGGIGGSFTEVANSITGLGGAATNISGRTTEQSNYQGPRARLAVLRFSDATGGRATGYRWYSREVGDSMARKLTAALLSTKRFRMVQRQNMGDLMNEINFGSSGAVQAGSAARFGKMVGARLIVTASITDFEDAGGSRGGAAASKRKKGIAGLIGATKRTYMAINLEVVDAQTSEIIASEQIDATVRDVNFGALLGGSSAAGAISGWDKEPKGKALQKVINSAVKYLEESIPKRYYTEAPA